MNMLEDFSNALRESAARVFRALSTSRKHRGLPVQCSLFPDDPRPMVALSAADMEALLCLAMVKELDEGCWSQVLAQYGAETDKGGCPKDAVEVVTVFYLALFHTCRAEQWIPVVQRLERMKEEPWPSLELMGRGR